MLLINAIQYLNIQLQLKSLSSKQFKTILF